MRRRSLSEQERARLDDILGVRIADTTRLERALTHASAGSAGAAHYERLEFLGDRVLGLVVAELLFRLFPAATEGELSIRLNQLVSAETCAAIADEIGLHEFIRVGSDVRRLTGARMASVRADVMESLVAAIYLEGGLEAARRFITRYWEARASDASAGRRDPKTELQEWAHAVAGATPTYRVQDRTGPDHDPTFMVIVEIDGLKPETGTGRSKRAAEQEAAMRFLVREGVLRVKVET